MAKRSQSISRALLIYAGLPMSLVVVLVVGWLTSSKVTDYLEKREAVNEGIQAQVLKMSDNPGDRVSEIEAIRQERMFVYNRRLGQDLALAVAILVIGLAVPLLVSRHVANLVQGNLSLLNDRLASGGRESSSLMPFSFDLKEFDQLMDTLRRSLRERGETEQRWKRAEKELVAANTDLIARAEELRNGRRVALSMMEDAENARRELEQANERLNEAIEQARQSAHAADVANKAKSDFLATMSHEIRTPLNGVIGFIEMLKDTKLDEEQLDYVETIRISGQSLMELINDILDFSKIESGHMNIEQREFNLVRMLRQVVALFFNEAAGKGLRLELDIDEFVPRRVRGDEIRIRQIITNLLGNALKFTEQGSIQVLVQAHSIKTDNMAFSELEIEVRDTGIGMSREQLERLFRPFSQGDSSTTRKYGGTGLGLAISKRLAEAMGGRVWATSTEGCGSSFYTRLRVGIPTEDEDSPEHAVSLDGRIRVGDRETPAESGAPGARVREDGEMRNGGEKDPSGKPGEQLPLEIMVAEDNRANQRVLMIMLRRIGWESVRFFENGEELIESMKTGPCDLVFMDLQMPEMDGLEATRVIRAGGAGEKAKTVKIIALTANALSGDAQRCMDAGMDAYLTKPIKIGLVKSAIEDLFQKA